MSRSDRGLRVVANARLKYIARRLEEIEKTGAKAAKDYETVIANVDSMKLSDEQKAKQREGLEANRQRTAQGVEKSRAKLEAERAELVTYVEGLSEEERSEQVLLRRIN